MDKKLIDQINQLAHKQKSQGLSPQEEALQAKLRQDYLKAFRSRMEDQIQSIRVLDPQGKDITPGRQSD